MVSPGRLVLYDYGTSGIRVIILNDDGTSRGFVSMMPAIGPNGLKGTFQVDIQKGDMSYNDMTVKVEI